MFNSWYVSDKISPDDKYTINLDLTDTTVTISLPDSYVLKKGFCITFSDPLVRLLSLPDKDFYFRESRTQHKTTITIVPPKSIVDNSQLLFRPNKTHPIEIAFEGKMVQLPGIHWTMKTINEAWKQVCKFQTTDQIYIDRDLWIRLPRCGLNEEICYYDLVQSLKRCLIKIVDGVPK